LPDNEKFEIFISLQICLFAMIGEEMLVVHFKVTFWHCHGGTMENHEILYQDSHYQAKTYTCIFSTEVTTGPTSLV
jgi:hypothetical protein